MKKSTEPIYRISMAVAMLFISLAIHAQRFVNTSLEGAQTVCAITQDSDGMIWLGTDNGLYSYDGYHGYRHFQEHTFCNTRVNALGFEGRMLYLATGNGILKFDTQSYQYAETPAMKAFADKAKRKQLKELRVLDIKGGKTDFGGDVYALLSTPRGLLVGSLAGLHLGSRLIPLRAGEQPLVNALAYDAKRRCYWIGTEGALYCADLQLRNFSQIPALNGNSIKCLSTDAAGNLYIGTDNGLYQMALSNAITHYIHDSRDDTSIPNNIVWACFVDKWQNVWVGTDNGLSRLTTHTYYRYVSLDKITMSGEGNCLHAMLQTRNGKRTAQAALKIACDLVDEGMITEQEAVLRVEPKQLDTLLHPQFDAAALKAAEVVGKGLAASPGSACGQIVFTAEEAEEMVKSGKMKKVVLVRLETSPEDIVGMQVSQGILTVRGGMTSHAAVVARGMGTCCVSGCGNDNEVKIDEEAKTFEINGHKFVEGDWISIDGSTGNIYGEQVATVAATGNKNFNRFMGWADAARQLLVMTNADNPRDAQQAVDLGAEGIGLCRTEHMFFAEDRIKAVREMICARTVEEREAALAKVEPFQQGDFEAMYRIMGERPMTIRYLDPPLHEFLPTKDEDIKELAADMGMTFDDLKNVVASLHEFNPMMGHRGCRLAVTFPEIAVMQTRAVIRAAINVQKRHPEWNMVPEIMIPLVGEVKELKYVKSIVVKTADEELAAAGMNMKYLVGTMIEIPRAALTAGEIAKEAEFFSFGTNDLTQMTFGFSRDDAGKFLGAYYDKKIYENDPFAKLDQVGVGKLVKMAAKLGRETRPDLHLGICGEHGGDPSSVEFCHKVGLNYVSCSPFRVPIARLAAAQAAIREQRQ